MALVKATLQSSIAAALQNARDNNWSLDQVAEAWANAIHSYVTAGDVKGVSCDVSVTVPMTGSNPEHGTGTATQSGVVHLT